jgi:uncharacterized protein YjbI with pentapeptide repeats
LISDWRLNVRKFRWRQAGAAELIEPGQQDWRITAMFRSFDKPAMTTALLKTVVTALFFFPLFTFGSPGSVAYAKCHSSAAPGVDWQGCRKRNLILKGSDLSGAKFAGTDFTATDLRDTKLTGADLTKATMMRSYLDGAEAEGANFSKLHGYRASFVGVNLKNASFVRAEMTRADFTGADLTNVNFERADLGRAVFKGASLTGANFPFVNLSRADFRASNFTGSIDFTGTYLFLTRFEGVNLGEAKGLEQWQFDLSCGDDKTQLPAGLDAPANWPCRPTG